MIVPTEMILPQKTIYQKGALMRLPEECALYGENGIIVHGRSFERSGSLSSLLNCFPREMHVASFCHQSGEPTLDDIAHVIAFAHTMKARWIVGVGGGSVIDVAKAAAGLFHASEKPVYYQEGGVLHEPGIPFIAVPTTAGTGSEATSNAVIINPEKKTKLSIRDARFMARTVILDVSLLSGMSDAVTAYAAMDAYVQAYESYVSKNATWFSEEYSLKAITLIDEAILPAYEKKDEASLARLLLGSYLAGVALAHARLGVIHGLAHPLGVLYEVPHGLVCAVCFCPTIMLNKPYVEKKYQTLSAHVHEDFYTRIQHIIQRLNIVSPFRGKICTDAGRIVAETLASGSTAANPKQVTASDVETMLTQIFV